MASTAAQDEFNALFNNSRSTGRTHPEDQVDRSETDSHQEPQNPRQLLSPLAASRNAHSNRDSEYDDLDNSRPPSFNGSVMRRNYYLPKIRSEANTGPKGVIADAQAFQLARREASRAASRAASSVNLPGNQTPAFQMGLDTIELQESERSSADDDDNDEADEGFLAKWRASRLSELASGKRPWYKKASSRKYGSLEHVDADRYLDAVEKSGKDTVVVVYIFDDMVSSLPSFPTPLICGDEH
jgi:Phosducin